jgi:parallel beta-helix repeat protein
VQSIAFSLSPDRRNRIYVAAAGDDTNGDGSSSAPFRTIGKALEAAQSGDSISVAEGAYNENVKLKSHVSIVGSGIETTILTGLGTSHTVEGLEVANVTVSGFTITGSGDSGSGVYLNGCRNIILRGNRIRDNGGSTVSHGIAMQNASEALIEKNFITDNFESGIFISGDSSAIVRNNIITGNGDSGIYSAGNRVSHIINNVIDRNGTNENGRSGIITGSGGIITNNIITYNAQWGIMAIEDALPRLSYNDVWNNNGNITSPQYEPGGLDAGEGAISRDPLFENSTNGNYQLASGDGSIINLGDPYLQNSGCNRINDLGEFISDMGAYGGPYGNW